MPTRIWETIKIAIEDYSTAIRLKPRDVLLAVAYFKRAKARSKLDDHIGAIEDYTEAIRLKSDNAAILNRCLPQSWTCEV